MKNYMLSCLVIITLTMAFVPETQARTTNMSVIEISNSYSMTCYLISISNPYWSELEAYGHVSYFCEPPSPYTGSGDFFSSCPGSGYELSAVFTATGGRNELAYMMDSTFPTEYISGETSETLNISSRQYCAIPGASTTTR